MENSTCLSNRKLNSKKCVESSGVSLAQSMDSLIERVGSLVKYGDNLVESSKEEDVMVESSDDEQVDSLASLASLGKQEGSLDGKLESSICLVQQLHN